jgi:hypothetical protein
VRIGINAWKTFRALMSCPAEPSLVVGPSPP